jgi:hypothetical protein
VGTHPLDEHFRLDAAGVGLAGAVPLLEQLGVQDVTDERIDAALTKKPDQPMRARLILILGARCEVRGGVLFVA